MEDWIWKLLAFQPAVLTLNADLTTSEKLDFHGCQKDDPKAKFQLLNFTITGVNYMGMLTCCMDVRTIALRNLTSRIPSSSPTSPMQDAPSRIFTHHSQLHATNPQQQFLDRQPAACSINVNYVRSKI
jgi:hypothetical protein